MKEVNKTGKEITDHKDNLVSVPCRKCAGRGKSSFGRSTEGGYPCSSCKGKGEKYVTKCCKKEPIDCNCQN